MSSHPTNLSSVRSQDLIKELIVRIDSIAQGITRSGQEVPLSADMLAQGWGEIVDSHVAASKDQNIFLRSVIGRHLISNCIKFYLMCIDDSHRLAPYKDILDKMSTAFSHFVRQDDVFASASDKARSSQHMQTMVQSFMSDLVPMMIHMWSQQKEEGLEPLMESFGINGSAAGLDSWMSSLDSK
jgi:uncharacterized protein YidB (DUF937 family)